MALKNTAAKPAPEFEGMDTTATEAAPAQVPATQKASLPSSAVYKPALHDKYQVLSLQDVEAIGFGTFPRLTVDLGGLMLDKTEVGKTAKLEVISWNFRHVITTNSQDPEAKEKTRISYDGETIQGSGESVQAYIDGLKAEGYEKAGSKLYCDLWGNLIFTEKQGDIPLDKQQMVQVQLSPQSLQQFKRYQLERGLKESRGMEPSTMVTITAERREFNGNRFGLMLFSA